MKYVVYNNTIVYEIILLVIKQSLIDLIKGQVRHMYKVVIIAPYEPP